MIGRPPGLDWVQTCVLKAACDVAIELWERRLTLDQVAGRLSALGISRDAIIDALEPLARCGYVYADDAPGIAEIVLHVTTRGLEEHCSRFVRGYGRISVDTLKLVCQDADADVVGLAVRSGQPELLVEHVLEIAASKGLVRLARTGHYITVREVSPQLRRWISGAA
jgi:hypothetical protein